MWPSVLLVSTCFLHSEGRQSWAPARELELTVLQTWSQQPGGYNRTAKVAVPAVSAGQKVPVVFHLHGGGGHGDTQPFGDFLGEDCIIVAPDGYERRWNVYSEPSKADDVQFILTLIEKVGQEIPEADMENVTIIGTSNGAALTHQLLISTEADRPFRRALPMVSSLIGPQYHEDQFWTFSQSAEPNKTNDFDVRRRPTFTEEFEYAHFHGTEDAACRYDGQNPGPDFLAGAEVLPAQLTDFLWARAMGHTGPQLEDSAGVEVGDWGRSVEEYRYLGGRARHYKMVGETHGSAWKHHPVMQRVVREMVLGTH